MTFEQLLGASPVGPHVGAGSRQPDRRAHRLQRRLRPARPPSRSARPWSWRRDRAARSARSASTWASPRRSSTSSAPSRAAAGGPTTSRASPGCSRGPGSRVGGADIRIESTVPLGSGLSSSAALEIALLRAFREAFIAAHRRRADGEAGPAGREPVRRARRSASWTRWRARWPATARRCSSTRGRSSGASCRCPRRPSWSSINSGVAHNHAKGDYRTRRAECEQAARLLGVGAAARPRRRRTCPGSWSLPEPLGRRARHVVTEDDRVLAAVAALRAGDVEALGRLFYASHESMRDDYEVSIPEIDLLVELARASAGRLRRPPDRRRLRRVGGHARQAGTRPRGGRRHRRGIHREVGEDGDGIGAVAGWRLAAGGP